MPATIRPTQDIDLYLSEITGAVDLLAQAQTQTGDDRIILLDLTADAWYEARCAANIYTDSFIVDGVAEIELAILADALIQPRAYLELCSVYDQKRRSALRRVLAEMGA